MSDEIKKEDPLDGEIPTHGVKKFEMKSYKKTIDPDDPPENETTETAESTEETVSDNISFTEEVTEEQTENTDTDSDEVSEQPASPNKAQTLDPSYHKEVQERIAAAREKSPTSQSGASSKSKSLEDQGFKRKSPDSEDVLADVFKDSEKQTSSENTPKTDKYGRLPLDESVSSELFEYRDVENEERTHVPVLNDYLRETSVLPENYEIVNSDKLKAEPGAVQQDVSNRLQKTSSMSNYDIERAMSKSSEPEDYQLTQVVAMVSGWYGTFSGLSTGDIIRLSTGNKTSYMQQQTVFQTVFNKLRGSSLAPDISFVTWLKTTAQSDFETLLYGIYCSTWVGKTSFDIRCGRCSKTTAFKAHNSMLIKYASPEVYDRLGVVFNDALKKTVDETQNEIDRDALNQEFYKLDFLNMRWRIQLPHSGDVVYLKIPTLYDILVASKRNSSLADQNKRENELDAAIINIDCYEVNGTDIVLTTSEVSHWSFISKRLNSLKAIDSEVISNQVVELIEDRFGISYSLDGVKCSNPECGYVIPRTPISVYDLLFRAISGRSLIRTL